MSFSQTVSQFGASISLTPLLVDQFGVKFLVGLITYQFLPQFYTHTDTGLIAVLSGERGLTGCSVHPLGSGQNISHLL